MVLFFRRKTDPAPRPPRQEVRRPSDRFGDEDWTPNAIVVAEIDMEVWLSWKKISEGRQQQG